MQVAVRQLQSSVVVRTVGQDGLRKTRHNQLQGWPFEEITLLQIAFWGLLRYPALVGEGPIREFRLNFNYEAQSETHVSL